jgi:SAM-dependent methyltransferase
MLCYQPRRLVDYFGPESFDVVVSTEVVEHVLDWRLVINNMKMMLKRGGIIYLTTRSKGFPYHAYPHDHWRYEPSDMVRIFRDFEIIRLEADWEGPGVFLKARKPLDWRPVDLSGIALYSVILGRRTRELVTLGDVPLVRRLVLYLCGSRLGWLLPGAVVHVLSRKYCS